MKVQPLMLNVPEPLYRRLEQRAEQMNRTVEAETLDFLATVVPMADELPSDLTEAISPLSLLEDEALWQAARSHLAAEAATSLEALHFKQQREGLTEMEAQTRATLVRQYERALLIRAQAAALLHQRGHDVSTLTAVP